MIKAKLILSIIVAAAAIAAAFAFKSRAFIGYINAGGIYQAVYVDNVCPDVGWGCLYTSNNNTYQVYTLSGIRMNPVKP